ncbi:MAG: tetratricopeptide repeat protein [Candidatus Kapabacteria bacterium]|nr:tetratricopeptide repeat protein [Candidatus Kapabacteria bacterium]
MNTHLLPAQPLTAQPVKRMVLGVRPCRCWSLVSVVVSVLLVIGHSLLSAQSSPPPVTQSSTQSPVPPLEQPSVLLYERAGKRCAEVSWQNLPQSPSRLTWYLQEHSAQNTYTCLIAPQLDGTKSYELSLETNLPLYHFKGASSHWVHPITIETMQRRYSTHATVLVSLFCPEDNDFVPSVFAERPVRMATFLAALLYVTRKETSKEFATTFREVLQETKPRFLRNPHPKHTVMDTLVRTSTRKGDPRIDPTGEPLSAFDMARIAGEYTRKHELDSAVQWYSKALRVCPTYAEAWYQRGHLYLHLDSYDKALYDFDQATTLDSLDYRAWGNRASALLRLNRYNEAVWSADKALAIKPDEDVTRFFRAVSYEALGDTASAANDAKLVVEAYLDKAGDESNVLEGALELLWRATTVEEWRNYFREQAERSADDDRTKSATMYWSQILRREPQNAEALYERCSCAVWGELPSYEARKYCDTLFRTSAFNGGFNDSLYVLRGFLQHREARYYQALEDYSAAVRLRPDKAYTYILRSQTRFAMKQTADSVEQDIRRAIAVAEVSSPDDKYIWKKAAEYFRVTKQFDSVVHYISHNIQRDSSDYSALHLRASAFDELEKREAIADYSRCIALVESLGEKAHEYYEELATLYNKRGRMKWIFDDSTAEADFSTSLRLYPTARAFRLRGAWYQSKGFYHEAMSNYDSVLARNPASEDALYAKADCYYRLNNYWEALPLLNRLATESKYRQADVYYLRAYVNSALDDDEGFCNDLQRAANAGSKEAEADLLQYCMGEESEGG